jgi:hypothetical protein
MKGVGKYKVIALAYQDPICLSYKPNTKPGPSKRNLAHTLLSHTYLGHLGWPNALHFSRGRRSVFDPHFHVAGRQDGCVDEDDKICIALGRTPTEESIGLACSLYSLGMAEEFAPQFARSTALP